MKRKIFYLITASLVTGLLLLSGCAGRKTDASNKSPIQIEEYTQPSTEESSFEATDTWEGEMPDIEVPETEEIPQKKIHLMAVGDCLFTRGRYAEALKIYEELNPDALADPSLAPVLRYRLGYTCLKLGEPDRAAQAFTALRGDKEFGDAADFYLGYILYAKGDYAAARKAFLACNLNTEPGVMADYYLMQMDYREENYQQAFTRAKAC